MTDVVARLATALSDRYVIERELGAGGMATVYLAHDVRHDRKVALKVLKPELSAILGAERFLKEIRTTANLQHPHILPLHDSGEADGTVYYVMPYVEGESLRDRLEREQQLPVEDAVRIAREVLDALAYAHTQGVIHRDIKPENILLYGGHALVADFGIALAASRTEGSKRLTETGMSLGTPAYMAPEQAMGEKAITPKADIYAVGCVLYEMLSGEPPFTGPTAQAIVARVMTEEPRSLALQRHTIPLHVEVAVRKALEKLPADRFATAADFAAALGNASYSTGALPGTRGRPAVARPHRRVLVALPWALLVGATTFVLWPWLRPVPPLVPPPLYRVTLQLPPSMDWVDQTGSAMALSPDGTVLAYSGRDSMGMRLYVRALAQLEPRAVSGSALGGQPFFSPDGRWLGFTLGARVMRAPVSGGPAETFCEFPGGAFGPTWLDSTHVVAEPVGPGLAICTLGGTATPLAPADAADDAGFPMVLPGGNVVVYTLRTTGGFRLAAYDLRTRQVKPLGIAGTNPHFVDGGFLVYANADGTIRAVPFDTARLAVSGDQMIVVENIFVGPAGAAKVAVAANGTLVAAIGASSLSSLAIVDRRGQATPLPVREASFQSPRFSPDGGRIAVTMSLATSDVWLFDRRQRTFSRLTFDSLAQRAAWSPDGRRLAFVQPAGPGVPAMLRVINADGSAPSESLLAHEGLGAWEAVFAPDDRSLIVRTADSSEERDIWRVRLDSVRSFRPLLTTSAQEGSPALSPDGHWMAYVSNESGRNEVYVRSFPDMRARFQVSLAGGAEPVFSPRGDELFYRDGTSLIAATIRTRPTFDVLQRTALFPTANYRSNIWTRSYDVAPDGNSFVMISRPPAVSDLLLVVNWFARVRAGAVAVGEQR